MDPRLRLVEVGVHHPQCDRLGDAQAGRRQQLEERPPLVGDLFQQPSELLPREKAALIELVRAAAATPRQQDHGLRTIAEQSSSSGVTQA